MATVRKRTLLPRFEPCPKPDWIGYHLEAFGYRLELIGCCLDLIGMRLESFGCVWIVVRFLSGFASTLEVRNLLLSNQRNQRNQCLNIL